MWLKGNEEKLKKAGSFIILIFNLLHDVYNATLYNNIFLTLYLNALVYCSWAIGAELSASRVIRRTKLNKLVNKRFSPEMNYVVVLLRILIGF